MGTPSIPAPPTPGQAATAQTGTTTANEILNIAGAPITSYADVIDQLALDPEFQQLQSAMQARSGLQGAQAQRETLAQVNPQAYENQQMLNDMSSQRLSQALGIPTGRALNENRPGQAPFNVPDTSQLPNLQFMTTLSNQLARALPTVQLDKNGNVQHIFPGQTPDDLSTLISRYSSRPNQIPTNADQPNAWTAVGQAASLSPRDILEFQQMGRTPAQVAQQFASGPSPLAPMASTSAASVNPWMNPFAAPTPGPQSKQFGPQGQQL